MRQTEGLLSEFAGIASLHRWSEMVVGRQVVEIGQVGSCADLARVAQAEEAYPRNAHRAAWRSANYRAHH